MKEGRQSYSLIRLLAKIFLVVWLLTISFQNTNITLPDFIVTATTAIIVIIYAICSVVQIYSLKNLFFQLIILLIGILSYYFTKTTLVLSILTSINVLKFLGKKEILKYYIILRTAFISWIVILSLLGAIENKYVVVVKSGVHYIGRYALGYTHPNQLAQALGALLLAFFCYKFKEKISLYNLSYFIILCFAIYYLTASRTFLIVASLFILASLLLNIQIKNSKQTIAESVLKYYGIYFLGILGSSLGSSFLMNRVSGKVQAFLYKLNDLLSSRLSFGSAVMQNYDVSLFGTTFDFKKLELWYGKFAVDSGYINLLYSFGLLPFIIFIYLNYKLLSNLYSSRYFVLCLSVLMILMWGTIENILTNVAVNFSILLIGTSIFEQSDNKVSM